MKEHVLGFAFSRDKKRILLIKKTKPDWQKGKLNGIGGKIEVGEEPLSAMYREFEEETTIKLPDDVWDYFGILRFKDDAVVYLYRAFTNLVYQAMSPTEEIVGLFNIDETIKYHYDLVPNLYYLIPLASDETTKFTFIEHK